MYKQDMHYVLWSKCIMHTHCRTWIWTLQNPSISLENLIWKTNSKGY